MKKRQQKKQTALVRRKAPALVRRKAPAIADEQGMTIEQTVQRLSEVRKFIRSVLKEDTDYGRIPGVNRKFLLQPGAEKICVWLGLKPEFDRMERDLGDGHIECVVVARLVQRSTGNVLNEAQASCSTMETNFRFRWAFTDPPAKQEVERLKAQGAGRWVPARMKAGKLVPKEKADKAKPDGFLWQQRFENPNIYDERNKVRQMAEKRALVKAIRRTGAMSEIFSEDPSEWTFNDDVQTVEEPPRDFVETATAKADERSEATKVVEEMLQQSSNVLQWGEKIRRCKTESAVFAAKRTAAKVLSEPEMAELDKIIVAHLGTLQTPHDDPAAAAYKAGLSQELVIVMRKVVPNYARKGIKLTQEESAIVNQLLVEAFGTADTKTIGAKRVEEIEAGLEKLRNLITNK